jgi:hypothetical protein
MEAHWLLHYKHVKVLPSFWIALYSQDDYVRFMDKTGQCVIWIRHVEMTVKTDEVVIMMKFIWIAN